MTTHLHADLLPVEATPFWNDYSWIHENHGYEMFSKSHAVILERRARKAEAQLAVAVEYLKLIEKQSTKEGGSAAWAALEKIKAIGGGE